MEPEVLERLFLQHGARGSQRTTTTRNAIAAVIDANKHEQATKKVAKNIPTNKHPARKTMEKSSALYIYKLKSILPINRASGFYVSTK